MVLQHCRLIYAHCPKPFVLVLVVYLTYDMSVNKLAISGLKESRRDDLYQHFYNIQTVNLFKLKNNTI